MPISMHGLDLSFMKHTPLPKRKKVKRPDFSVHRSDLPKPFFMPDISPFVSVVGKNPEVISSRKHLRDHERAYNVKQAGDFKPGEIIAENAKKKAELEALAATVDHGWVDPD